MHVLRIVGLADDDSAAEDYVDSTSAPLIARGVRISALYPFAAAASETLRRRGIDVAFCPIARSPSWIALRTAAALVETKGVDVIETHEANAHVLGALASAMTGRRAIAVMHEHAINMLELEALRLHDGMHVLVPFAGTALQARMLGVDAARLHVVRTPVPLVESTRPPTLQHRVGIAPDVPIVGGVGPATSEAFVRAAVLVARRMPHVHFAWVGGGARTRALVALAERLGVGSRFHAMPARADMRLLPSLSVAVVPIATDGAGRSALAAMAAGCALVAARSGGLAETVVHRESGLLVEQGAAMPLADAVVELLRDARQREALGRNARDAIRRHHAPDQVIPELCALYERVARWAPARAPDDATLPT